MLDKKFMNDYELEFYKRLKRIADKYNLQIFAKIALKDLIKPKENANKNEIELYQEIENEKIDYLLYNPQKNTVTDLIQTKKANSEILVDIEMACMDAGYHIIYAYDISDERLQESIEWNQRFFG